MMAIAGYRAAEQQAENLAAASTPAEAFRLARAMVEDAKFTGTIAMLSASKLRGDDPRLLTVIIDSIKGVAGLSDDEAEGCLAEHVAALAQNADKLAPRETMLSKAMVDVRAARASATITKLLDNFVSRTACRLPGASVSDSVNLLLDHMRPVLAEIKREIDIFRVEVGSAPPALTLEAVNDQGAQFWRDWQRVCGVRADGLERRGK